MTSDQQNETKKQFWSGLLKGEINISRPYLLTWWPGFAAFFWLFYLLAFAACSLILFAPSGAPEHAMKTIALIAMLHAGGLVALYLSSLAESAQGDEKDDEYPLAVSLQANFVEAIGLAGVIIFVIGKQLVEFAEEHENIFNERPYLRELIALFNGTDAQQSGIYFIIVAIILLIGVILLGHAGFLLLKRRNHLGLNYLFGVFRNEGEPPIGSGSVKERIVYLTKLRNDLLAKAEREDGLAGAEERRAKALAAEIARLTTSVTETQREYDLLVADEAEFSSAFAAVGVELDSLKAKASDQTRISTQRLLGKIAELTASAFGLLTTTKKLVVDGCEKLQKQIEEDTTTIARLVAEKADAEAKAQFHRTEAIRLRDEAKKLEMEIAQLVTHAAHIDSTNVEWALPRDWEAEITRDKMLINHAIPSQAYNNGKLASDPKDTINSIRRNTVVLFFFTVLLGIVDDLFLETGRMAHPSTLFQSFTDHAFLWSATLAGIVAFYILMKFVYSIGLVGSWRSIATGYSDPKDSSSAPKLSETLSVVLANALGVLAFAAILIPLIVWLNNAALAEGKQLAYLNIGGWREIDLKLLYLRMMEYHVVEFFLFAALLLIFAPIAVYLWEKLFRATDDFTGVRSKLQAAMLSIATILFAGLLFWGGTDVIHKIKFAPTKDIIVTTPPPVLTSQVACPFAVSTLSNGATAATWNADWSYAKDDQIAKGMNLKDETKCSFTVGNDKQANYVVVVGTASQEGDPEKQKELSNRRIEAVLANLDRKTLVGGDSQVTVYVWSLGKFEPKVAGLTPDATVTQRPLIIISGHADDDLKRTEEIKSILQDNFGIAFDSKDGKLGTPLHYHPEKAVPTKYLLCPDNRLLETCPVQSGAVTTKQVTVSAR